MRGAPLIYQAALADYTWIGFADFLVRVASPCPRWAWSYEPWDAKLARSARPEHLLQLALYGDLLAAIQARGVAQGWLMLGSGDHAVPYVAEPFRLDEVRYYVRRAGAAARGLRSRPAGGTRARALCLLRQVSLAAGVRGALGGNRPPLPRGRHHQAADAPIIRGGCAHARHAGHS